MSNRISKTTFRLTVSIIACSVVISGLLASNRRASSSALSRKTVTLTAKRDGNPYVILQDGRELQASFKGQVSAQSAADVIESDAARPLALASADFNVDGFPDLVCGYATSSGGLLTLHTGDPEAFSPKNPDVLKGVANSQFPDPFLKEATTIELPEAPDFIGAGDFNRDGRADLIVAARGGNALYLLAGDGSGGFSSPQLISLPGAVTAMVIGQIDQPDGAADVIVGVATPGGASVLVFEGSQNLLEVEPIAHPLPAEATSLALGRLDDDRLGDLAILAGGQLLILHGQDPSGAKDPSDDARAGRLEPVSLPFEVNAIALGEFIWDRDSRTETAALAADGTVHILARGELDTRPWTADEMLEKRRALERIREAQEAGQKIETMSVASKSGEELKWQVAEDLPASAANSLQNAAPISNPDSSRPILLSMRISAQPSDDLLIMNPATHQFQMMYKPGKKQDDAKVAEQSVERSAVDLETNDDVTAVLPMRLNVDGRPGLVVMSKGGKSPSLVMPMAGSTFTVTTTTDSATAGSGSLRRAIIDANANPGADMIVFNAGINPTLTITGSDNAAAVGDLDINDSVTITGNSPTTISTTYTTGCGDCKVFGVNQDGSHMGMAISFSGLTIQNGFNDFSTSCLSTFQETGGGLDFFLTGSGNSYSMSNCIITNNQATGSACAGRHGGGINVDSNFQAMAGGTSAGTVTFTNCTFSKNTAQQAGGGLTLAADKHDVTMTNCTVGGPLAADGNQSNVVGVGGGIWTRHSFGGTVTITGGTIQNNKASNSTAGGAGGGIEIDGNQVTNISSITMSNNSVLSAGGASSIAGGVGINNLGAAGVTGSTTISNSTISTNHADNGTAAQGGGVYFNARYSATISNCTISSNTSGRGAGVFNGGSGGPQTLTIDTGSTISSNTAAGSGGGVANIDSLAATTILNGITIDSNTSGSGGSGIDQSADSNNTGSTFTLQGTINVNGGNSIFLSQTNGTFTSTSGTLNITGNFTRTAGTFTHNSGTVVFNGSGAQSLGTLSTTFNNLTVNKSSGTLTLGGNAPVAGDLTLTNGIFDLSTFTANRTAAGGTLTVSNASTLKIGGTNTLPSNFTTHSISASSTIEYEGTNQNVATLNSSQKYGNLVTSGSGTKTLAGAISIATSLTIGASTTLDASASNFSINDAGNWTNNGTFTPRSGTVTFDGSSGIQTLSGNTTFFNLTLNNSGATTAFGSTTTTIGNNLVTSAGTMDGGTGTIIFTGGSGAISGANAKNFNNLQINNAASISNNTGGNTTIKNDYTNNGTFTQAASLTTTFATGADGSHSLSGNGTTTFGNVTINSSNTVDAGSHNFSVVGASFTVTGTFTGNTSTVTFNGGVAQAITGDGAKNFSGLTINNGNGVTINDTTPAVDATVSGALTLTTDLTIAAGAVLQQSGTSAGGADAVGTVRRTDLGVTARAFGNPNVTIAIDSGTPPTQMDVNLVKSAPADFLTAVTRDYTLTPTGGSGISATLKLHYLNAELNGNTETKLALWKKITGTWTAQGRTGAVDTVNKAVSLSGVSSFSEWTLAQVDPPTISKAFGASSIPLNGTTTLTFTITNPNASTGLAGIGFTDSLPSGLEVANPPGVSNTCSGTFSPAAGDTTLNFSGGSLAASGTCTVSVSVKGTTAGAKANTTGAISATESGTGTTSNTAMLTVVGPPTISKSFATANISTATESGTTVTITTTAPHGFTTGQTVLIAGVGVAGYNGTFVITGTPTPTTFTYTATAGLANSSGGTATVTAIPLGSTTTLSFTITNPNTTSGLSGIGFTDMLPAGLTVATSGPTVTCGGTLTTTAPDTITLTGASLAASASCTFSVTVTGSTAGVKNNTTGAITSNEGGTGTTSNTATLTVIAPPTISKSFGAANIAVGGTTSLSFTITNPNTTVGLTGVGFTDTLPAGLTVADSSTSQCGGTLTTTNATGVISLAGASIAASGNCMFSVTVTGTTSGVKNNTTGAVTSSNGGTGTTSNTASVTVASPPTLTKSFGASSVLLGATTSLTFTMTNPNSSINLTGISFTDTLPAGLTVATSGPTAACGGTVSTTAPGTISFTGGTLGTGGSNSCNFSVTVTGSTTGVWMNTSGAISSNESGAGATSNTATLTVIGPVQISKSFSAATIPLGGTATLTFTITNPNTTTALTGVAFTDSLPAGLEVAATPNASNTCTGTFTPAAGDTTLTFSGGSIAASGTCTVKVDVKGTTAGVKNNTSGNVTSNETAQGNTASATITVVAPPSIAKSFNPTNIPVNGTSTLTFTITNPNSTVALTGVGFTDMLPSGVTVANSGPTSTCGGSVTTTAPDTITLSGATIAASGTCQFNVTVTGATAGVKNNTSGAVTSANGGTGNTASATLTVATPPTITKAFGASSVLLGATTSLTFTINNPNATQNLTGISFTDTLPAGVTVATSGPTAACGGTLTTTAPSTISFSGGTLTGGGSCNFSVTVTGSTTGVWNNTTGAISSNESGAGATSNTATLTVIGPPSISKSFDAATIPQGGTSVLTFTITNPNTTTTLNGIAFTDTLPSGLTVATGSSTQCGGTLTTTAPNSISFSGGTLTSSSNCMITVTVTGATAGVKSNTTGQVSSTNGGTGGTSNTASITVVAPPQISKAFNPNLIVPGGTSSLMFTITNPNSTVSLTGVAFTDTLPSGVTVADSSTSQCGGTLTTTNATGIISLSGATIAASGMCQFSVTVTGATPGPKHNMTGNVTSSNGGTGNSASADLTVGIPPTISCPANIVVNATQGQCSASVQFNVTATGTPAPAITCKVGNTVITSPNTFPVGTTTVNCTASNGVPPDASCSFTVTVNDTQPPVFPNGCPSNVTATAAASCPFATGKVVTFPTPAATDNCGVQSVVCNPPSGSIFPAGTTTVTCTATDAANNMTQCTFTVTTFSLCLQDETNTGNFVIFNPVTGDFQFFCNGVLIASGTGTSNIKGCEGTIMQAKGERRVTIAFDTTANGGKGSGTATLSNPPSTVRCQILDKDMSNNTCSAPGPVAAPERGRERVREP